MANKKAVLVIDMLNDFVGENGALYNKCYKDIVPNINCIIKTARDNNILVIFIQHSYPPLNKVDKLRNMSNEMVLIEGTYGSEIYTEMDFKPKLDYVVKKRKFNSFYGTDLDNILRENNIKDLIITGIKTNNCVRATIDNAFNLGYNIIIPVDSIATHEIETNQAHLYDFSNYYGQLLNKTEIINFMIKNNKQLN
ncbi:hypothetical protein ACTA71_011894 [Dictyostelium dimigraforme]